MGSKFRDRKSDLRRRSPTREPKIRILVVCEGKRTEHDYFRDFQHDFKHHSVHVEVAGEGCVPRTLVGRAIKLRNSANNRATAVHDDNERFEEIWCVMDVDDHPHLESALALAKKEGIQVALSDPCFELWALLHFEDQSEAIHRKKVQQKLKRHLPRYEKVLPFPVLKPGYEAALQRAVSLKKSAKAGGTTKRNLSTDVHLLTERIRKLGRDG